MSWRDILVFADASDDGVVRLRLALAIARAYESHLEANVVVPMPDPIRGMNDVYFVRVYEELREKARKDGAAAVARLSELAPAELVSVRAGEAMLGDVRALAARAARTADLVVVGQPEALDKSELDTDIFVGALLGGGRPVLMLPRWIEPHPWGRRALIAWKGTPEASRAVRGSLPLLKTAETVRICLVNPRSEREGEDDLSLSRLAAYLERHGARVEEPVIRTSWEGPEKLFSSEIEGFGADLLVMGAYSRPRLQEILFGGMTAAMVRNARIPVLLAH
jgi:nucleotide-binding universal stress UspA family protein